MRTIGRYEVVTEIGRGGMATVYRAGDPRFGRDVAVKVLPPAFTHDPQFLGRFKQEAKAVASLEHQFVVPVYDFGQEGDQPYLVMRYMAGGSLKGRIRSGPMSLEEAIAILGPIAKALDYAHSRGLIHRDVKPGNILFDQSGGAYLSDFGIVKMAEATASFTGGAIVGTPAYMSPEQIQGGAEIDGRTDVYALGITFFEMLAGEVPYQGETTTQQLMKHILEPVPQLSSVRSDLPPDVQAALSRALAKDRDARFPTATAFVHALEAARTGTYAAAAELAQAESAQAESATVPMGLERPVPQRSNYTQASPPDRLAATEVHEMEPGPSVSAPRKLGALSPYVVGAIVALALFLIGGGTVLAMTGAWRPLAARMPADTPTSILEVSATDTLTPAPTATSTPAASSTAVASETPTSTPTPSPTVTATVEDAPTMMPSFTPTPTETPRVVATNTPVRPTSTPMPPTATPTVEAGPLMLSHNVDSVTCVPDKTYMVRFTLYVGGGTGQHAIYRDVDTQVVYPLGSERSVTYELEWGRNNAAVGTFYVRSGDQRVESKFYVPYPDCGDT